MSASASYPFTIANQYGQTLVVYSTMNQTVSDPPPIDTSTYVPTYTQLGTVAPGQTGNFSTANGVTRIVIARASDEFPIKLAIINALIPANQSVSVTADDETVSNYAWSFYKSYASQPFQPMAVQFNELVLTSTDLSQLTQQSSSFFSSNGYPGVDLGIFSMISYWATNSLYAFPGTYWCYEPQSDVEGFVLPTTPVGTITIANGTATYTPTTGGNPVPLSLSRSCLASTGATIQTGIMLTGIARDLAWEGQPDQIAMCFVGTNNGASLIAQPYQNISLPWYAVAYDLVYGAFYTIQLVMTADMAVQMVQQVAGGLQYLNNNWSNLINKFRQWANTIGQNAGPDSALGDDVDPINVDVDVDVDIDVDVDVDVDVDIDVDTDVDIDVDADIDFGVVVDIDVDVDIDSDVDVVTDTETDVDTDVDVDIDTDVNVQPGMIRGLLNNLGNWLMTKGVPALVELLIINFAFQSAAQLLQAWKDADEQGIMDLQPRESTGLGLLINFMLNEQQSIQARWNIFADYVQQAQPDPVTIEMTISSILMAKNDPADSAATAWSWSTDDENAAVSAMAGNTGTNLYKAFQALGGYSYNHQPLPVKVGAQVAMVYLKQQSPPSG